MKRVAFVFTHGPHGGAGGRKGWMRCSPRRRSAKTWGCFCRRWRIAAVAGPATGKILARNYIATFGVLPLYDVERCYLCRASLQGVG